MAEKEGVTWTRGAGRPWGQLRDLHGVFRDAALLHGHKTACTAAGTAPTRSLVRVSTMGPFLEAMEGLEFRPTEILVV